MDRRFFNPEMSFHRHGSRAAVQVPRCGSVRWCAARRQTRIALSAGLMFASALVSHCIAEPPEKGTTENPGTILNAEGQELPTDRRAIQLLEDLSAAVTREQLPEIRDQLLRIAAFDAQLLVARSGDVWEPVYRRTFREFHRLRPGLQELLRRENKELAENELLRVAALGQTGPLIQVIHRFPGSPASYQAHLLIAQQHLDRGNRRAAVYWLKVLEEAGPPERWRSATTQLLRSISGDILDSKSPMLQGRTADPAQRPANQSRPSEVPGTSTSASTRNPLHIHWSFRPPFSPLTGTVADRLISSANEIGVIPWTRWAPIISQDILFCRTMKGVTALDRRNGQPLWLWSGHSDLETPLGITPRTSDDPPAPAGAAASNSFAGLDRSPLSDLLMRNGVVGRLSTDGNRVFLVHTPIPELSRSTEGAFQIRGEAAQEAYSELIALDCRSGRRLWTSGGRPVEQIFHNELTMAWFSGPPKAVGDQLLCVCEQSEAESQTPVISLNCLAADSGQLLWRVPLTLPPVPIGKDASRQTRAAESTSFQGIIWITTTTGWLTAVDLVSRSVLWTSRIEAYGPSTTEDVRNGQGIPGGQQLSLRDGRRGHSPVLSDDHLIVFPETARHVVVLDPYSGLLKHHIQPHDGSMILLADQNSVVIAGRNSIEAFRIQDGTTLWKTSLPRNRSKSEPGATPFPVGPAALRQEEMIIPLSDGSLLCMQLSDGTITDSLSGVKPAEAWGGFFAAEPQPDALTQVDSGLPNATEAPSLKEPLEIFHFSPRQVVLFSDREPVAPANDPLAAATVLLANGQTADALKQLEKIDERDGQRNEQLRRLRFTCQLRLLVASDPSAFGFQQTGPQPIESDTETAGTSIDALKQLAASANDHAQVEWLTIQRMIADGQHQEAADQIVLLLKSDGQILQEDIFADSAGSPESSVERQITLQTWLQSRFASLLDRTSSTVTSDSISDETLTSLLSQLHDDALTGIPSDRIVSERLARADRRLAEGDFSGQTLQLILCCADPDLISDAYFRELQNRLELVKSGPGAEARAPRTRGPGSEAPSATVPEGPNKFGSPEVSLENQLRQHLLTALLDEIRSRKQTSGFSPDTFVPPPQAAAEPWPAWTSRTYQTVPVSQSVSFRQSEQILLAESTSDPLFNGIEWHLLRQPPLLKAVNPESFPQQIWSVAGDFSDHVPFSVSADVICRFGSVIVIKTAQSLSAVSVPDQKTLWTRKFTDAPLLNPGGNSLQMRFFQDTQTDQLLKAVPGRQHSVQICGGTAAWICIKSRQRIEVLDLFTGRRRWSLINTPEHVRALATSTRVLLWDPITGRVSSFRSGDGTPTETLVSAEDLDHALLATNGDLAVLRPRSHDRDFCSLIWMSPVTGTASKRLDLPGVRYFQFSDASTLIGTSGDEYLVIDLKSGGHERFKLPAAFTDPADSGVDPDRASGERSVEDETSAQSEQTHGRGPVAIFSDPTGFYLFRVAETPSKPMVRFPGRNLVPVSGNLTAVDRRSGTARWSIDAGEQMMATFDQPLSPVLLLLHAEHPGRNAVRQPGVFGQPGAPTLSFRGILKANGKTLFEHRLTARYPVPFVRMLTGADQTVDVEAFGSRVRFIPQ